MSTKNSYNGLPSWTITVLYEQLEKDIADGQLKDLAQEAIADFEAGRYREI